MTTFHTAQVDGLNVFYRQAGDPTNPKLLLLGGFPSSSHQFRNLMPALAEHFHVVSPDRWASTCRTTPSRPSIRPGTRTSA